MTRPGLALMVCGAAVLTTSAARGESDFELWTEAGARLKVAKRLHLGFDQHVRFEDDASRTQSVMPEAYVRWRPKKWLTLQGGYRFIADPQYSMSDTYWDAWHRPYGDAGVRARLAPFAVGYRLRYQHELGRPWDEDGELVQKSTLRNRLELSYEIVESLTIESKNELFFRLNGPDDTVHKFRSLLEVAWDFGDHELALFGGFEERLNDDDEPTVHILGLSYHFEP